MDKTDTNRIIFLCVNYGSYNELFRYLSSIDIATEKVIKEWQIEVMIADNTVTNHKQIDSNKYLNI